MCASQAAYRWVHGAEGIGWASGQKNVTHKSQAVEVSTLHTSRLRHPLLRLHGPFSLRLLHVLVGRKCANARSQTPDTRS